MLFPQHETINFTKHEIGTLRIFKDYFHIRATRTLIFVSQTNPVLYRHSPWKSSAFVFLATKLNKKTKKKKKKTTKRVSVDLAKWDTPAEGTEIPSNRRIELSCFSLRSCCKPHHGSPARLCCISNKWRFNRCCAISCIEIKIWRMLSTIFETKMS